MFLTAAKRSSPPGSDSRIAKRKEAHPHSAQFCGVDLRQDLTVNGAKWSLTSYCPSAPISPAPQDGRSSPVPSEQTELRPKLHGRRLASRFRAQLARKRLAFATVSLGTLGTRSGNEIDAFRLPNPNRDRLIFRPQLSAHADWSQHFSVPWRVDGHSPADARQVVDP